jgi:hypothetical protein
VEIVLHLIFFMEARFGAGSFRPEVGKIV